MNILRRVSNPAFLEVVEGALMVSFIFFPICFGVLILK